MSDGGLISEDFARDTAEMLRWWKRNRHQLAQTQAMAYREGPEEQIVIKARNASGETLKQYQPVMLYGPDGGSSEANNTLQAADFSLDNFEYTVTKLKTSGPRRPSWIWQRWGVVQEELAANASGRVVVNGLTPIRILYDAADAADLAGTVYQGVVPVVDQNYARHCKQGPARRLKQNTVAADADGVIIDYCMLGQAMNDIGVKYANREVTGTTVTDAANTYHGIVHSISNDRGCFTKPFTLAAGSISWDGYTTLGTDVVGVEIIEPCHLWAKCSATVRWAANGSDSDHRLWMSWVMLDASNNFYVVRGGSNARFTKRDYTVSSTTFTVYDTQCQYPQIETKEFLPAGYKIFPVVYTDTGTGHTFTVVDLSLEFIELLDQY
jgi:hypothetical protein